MDISYCKQHYEPIDGSWYITRELGHGAFGTVFEIERWDGTAEKAALKVISVPLSQSEVQIFRNTNPGMDENAVKAHFYGAVDALTKEIQSVSALGNSNIVSISGCTVHAHEGEIGWDILVRMEQLETINEYFSKTPVSEDIVKKLGMDVCRALDTCGRHNICHRNIKPENIFVTDSGEFKVSDFGVMRTLERVTCDFTKTPDCTYMAPEVYGGRPYGAAADIYSLGIVMYKLLNNNLVPFCTDHSQESEQGALSIRMSGAPMPVPANASPALCEVILKACNANPSERFSNAEEMLKALENVPLAGATPVAEVPVEDLSDVIAAAVPTEQPETVADEPVPQQYEQEISVAPAAVAPAVAVAEPQVSVAEPAKKPKKVKQEKPKKVKKEKPPKEKKKGKAGIIIIVSLLVLIIAAAAFFGVAYYLNEKAEAEKAAEMEDQYRDAMELYNDSKYKEAKSEFEELGDYKKSKDKVVECSYFLAEELMEAGKYEDAKALLDEIREFKDSEALISECDFSLAMSLFDEEKYEDAKKAFEALAEADYEGADEKVKECDYQMAKQLLDDEKFDEAKKAFDALGKFKDSEDMTKECDYQKAKQLLEDGKNDEAKKIFDTLGGYKDSEEIISNFEYELAKQLLESGKYEEAKAEFERLSYYMDTDSDIDECDYQIALSHKSRGEYAKAMAIFHKLGDYYKDSYTMWYECEEAIINMNVGNGYYADESTMFGVWSDAEGNNIEYIDNGYGSHTCSYNLTVSDGTYFKMENGIHYLGEDPYWEKQWLFQRVNDSTIDVYNYIDGEVYTLTRN